MRKILYTFCFTCSLLIMLQGLVFAQTQKIGYVNTDTILSQIPEYKGIQQQLKVTGDQWRAELQTMQEDIDRLNEDFEAKEILYTDEVREQKKQEIVQKKQARQQFLEQKFGAQGDYFQKQKELLEPIQRKVYEAITAIAQRLEIDFIFDRAKNSSMLFGRKQWNLNEDVLQELGISLNE